MAQAQLDVPARESARPAAAARPRLYRSRRNRIIGGVAAGVAEHLGTPAWAVRLAFVVLTAAAGFGLVVYLLLWPRWSRRTRRPQPRLRRPRRDPVAAS
jgi:phage shock protein PspC (stress-responsive transcriptional regulator)